MDIIIPVKQRVVSADHTLQVPYRCEHCGFESVARAIGRGSAATDPQLPFALQTSMRKETDAAQSKAIADGKEQLALVRCARCGKRNSADWARYMRMTRLMQGAVAAIFVTIIVLIAIQTPDDAAIGLVVALPGALAVFLVGFLRGLRADVSANRVKFLSPEDLAAEAEQAAKKQAEEDAEEAAAEAKAEARRARRHRKRAARTQ